MQHAKYAKFDFLYILSNSCGLTLAFLRAFCYNVFVKISKKERFFMYKKMWILIAALILTIAVLTFGASATNAASDTVYVPTGAATLADAVALLPNGGTIIITDTLTVRAVTLPEVGGNLTIAAENGGALSLTGDLGFAQNTNNNVITLDLPLTANGHVIFGGFNSIIFGENFTVSDSVDFYGGVLSTAGTRGEHDANRTLNATFITELPYFITVYNGTFGTFAGGNLRKDKSAMIGSIADTLTVTVYGGTFNDAFSLSGMSFLAHDATLTVNGGIFNAPVFAQGAVGAEFTNADGTVTVASTGSDASYCSTLTASDKKYFAADGEVALNLNGGTFNGGKISAHDTLASFTQCLRGNFTLTIGENAIFADGTILDATQVKAYTGENKTATLSCPDASIFTVKRFDTVNTVDMTDTFTEPLRISFIGDSITQGTGATLELTRSYSAQFKGLTDAAKMDVVVGNYGVGSAYILPYGNGHYNNTLAHKIAYYEADSDYVLIALGTNDAASAGGTYGQAMQFTEMYEDFLRLYGDLQTTKRIYTTSAIYRLTSNKPADVRAVSVIRPTQKLITEKLAAEEPTKYFFVDLYALLYDAAVTDALFAGDKLHPDADGYTIYAQAIYDAIFNNKHTVENFTMSDVYISASGRLAGAGTEADPMSSLTTAFGRLASTGTLHVMGTFTYPDKIVTPMYMEKMTIEGYETGAELAINGDTTKFLSDIVMRNIHLTSTYANPYLTANWNNITLEETFSSSDNFLFVAGQVLFYDDITKTAYDNAETASISKDVTVTVNGGSFARFVGGNARLADNSPYGTFSGNMTLTIGSGVTIKANALNGIGGQNYTTGKTTAYINSWPANQLCRDHSRVGSLDTPDRFNEIYNTGTVEFHFGEGVSAKPIITGDFNNDKTVDLQDALLMLKAKLDDNNDNEIHNLYSYKYISFTNVMRAIQKLMK